MGFDLIIFGGTGDLAWRKLMPALFQAFRHGTLPAGGRIIGVGRDELDDAQYRERIKARFESVDLAKRPSEAEFTEFAALLQFVPMDLSRPSDYARLAATLQQRATDSRAPSAGRPGHRPDIEPGGALSLAHICTIHSYRGSP